MTSSCKTKVEAVSACISLILGPVTPYVDIDLGQHWLRYNRLLPDDTKLLPEPMLTNHQQGLVVTFIGNAQDFYPWYGLFDMEKSIRK